MPKAKLDKRRINFVKGLSTDVKAKILYEYLKKGTSNRDVEEMIEQLVESDGWQSWSVIHFYGHNKYSKSQYPNITLSSLKRSLVEIKDNDLEDFHLENTNTEKEIQINTVIGENDGKDVLRTIKTRQGQYKLRKLLIVNYQSKCALCNISHPKLLITSHIKTWSDSSREERVDPCNGILLCEIHDALFEHGFISLNDKYHVLFSSKFNFAGQGIAKNLTFTVPVKELPSPKFLKEHRLKYGYE